MINYSAEMLDLELLAHASKLQSVRELLESAEDIGDEEMVGICHDALSGDARALEIALDFWATFKEDNEL